MAGVTRKHNIYAVNFNDESDTQIAGIVDQNLRFDHTVRAEGSSGTIYPQHISNVGTRFGGSFSTLHLKSALTAIQTGSPPLALFIRSAGLLATGFEFFAQAHADGGSRATGANHRSYTVKKGLIYCDRLSASHQGDALLTCGVLPTWDGTNDPIAYADGASVPTLVADDQRYTLGPVTVAGIVIPQVRSIELNFGIQVSTEGADSELYDRFASVVQVRPVLVLRGIDVTWWASAIIPTLGILGSAANTKIYLRRRTSGGGLDSDVTATHIKLVIPGYSIIGDPFSGRGTDAAETSIMLTARYDGTNAPIVATIDTAIS